MNIEQISQMTLEQLRCEKIAQCPNGHFYSEATMTTGWEPCPECTRLKIGWATPSPELEAKR